MENEHPPLDLAGFVFATPHGRRAVEEWCQSVKSSPETHRHPMLVVVGPPFSGKTELAKRVLHHIGAAEFTEMDPSHPRAFDNLAASKARGALLDLSFGLGSKQRFKFWQSLHMWLICQSYSFVPLGSKDTKTQEIRTVMVATTKAVVMTSDLARLSVFVPLKERKEAA